MKARLHLLALLLFLATLVYDLVVWGALPALPEIGASIADSARREAPLAATYVALGRHLDAAIPTLRAFGEQRLTAAFEAGFERIRAEPTVAMDLIFDTTWNHQHRWIKLAYWAAPLLLLLTLVLWLRRPRQVRTLGRR